MRHLYIWAFCGNKRKFHKNNTTTFSLRSWIWSTVGSEARNVVPFYGRALRAGQSCVCHCVIYVPLGGQHLCGAEDLCWGVGGAHKVITARFTAWGVPPLTMPHKGDLKLPPVTQGDVTTNKINATRTDSNKCHLNGVSNISVWVFTICPKRGLSSVQMRQPQDQSFEIYVNYHRRYDGEIQGF